MNRSRGLTPGQTQTLKFPVVGEREAPPFTLDDWRLSVDGLVVRPLTLTFDEVARLPPAELVCDTICVTGWTHLDHRWRGVLLSTVLDVAQVSLHAKFVRFVAYSSRDHDTSLPLDYARRHVMLAYEVDGEPLTPEHGSPLRSVAEGRYFYKSVKWLRRVELLEEDRLGFWERTSAYHNVADPLLQQRYDPKPMDAREFRQRTAGRNFHSASAIMDPQFAGLRGVDLAGATFEGASIKACDLSGANLEDARCHGANFTRSKFLDAILRGADLSASDLEGADFRGADLREADLRGASLTATRFHARHRTTLMAGARLRAGDLSNDGLDPADRAFLNDPTTGIVLE